MQWNAFIVDCIIDISIEKHVQFVWRLDLNKTKEHTMHMMNFLPFLFVHVVFRSFLTTIMCVWLGHIHIFFLSFSLIHLNATITSPIKNHFVCSISIFDFILFFFRFVSFHLISLFLFNYFHFTISIFNLFHFVLVKFMNANTLNCVYMRGGNGVGDAINAIQSNSTLHNISKCQ